MPTPNHAGKYTSNFIFLIINPIYSFVLTALTGLYHLSITAKAIPILGSVFALIALTLNSIITVLDTKKSLKEKIGTLIILGIAISFIATTLALAGTVAATFIGIGLAGFMSFLQIGDLRGKIGKFFTIKKESDSKEQLLKALNEEDGYKNLPLTKKIHKWAIIYSKMVAVEKKIPNLDATELQNYENLEKKLHGLIQRYNTEPLDTAEKDTFHLALEEGTLNKLPQKEEFYKLAKDTRQAVRLNQPNDFKEQEARLNKYIQNYDFRRLTKILNLLTLGIEPDTKNQILQAIKKGKEDELPLEADIYKWGKVFSNIVQRELKAPYLSKEEKVRFENLASKLEKLERRFDGSIDFDKTTVDTDSFDLESLELKKMEILKNAKNDPNNAKSYSQQILAMNTRINKIAAPLAKLREKKDKAILNIAYSSCDLLLALAGVALATLGLAAIIAAAPVSIPIVATSLGLVIGGVAILRGGSKITFDLLKKWDSHKDEIVKLEELENHITSPELYERPKHMKSSDLSMLAIFRNNPTKPVEKKKKPTASVTVDNSIQPTTATVPTIATVTPPAPTTVPTIAAVTPPAPTTVPTIAAVTPPGPTSVSTIPVVTPPAPTSVPTIPVVTPPAPPTVPIIPVVTPPAPTTAPAAPTPMPKPKVANDTEGEGEGEGRKITM